MTTLCSESLMALDEGYVIVICSTGRGVRFIVQIGSDSGVALSRSLGSMTNFHCVLIGRHVGHRRLHRTTPSFLILSLFSRLHLRIPPYFLRLQSHTAARGDECKRLVLVCTHRQPAGRPATERQSVHGVFSQGIRWGNRDLADSGGQGCIACAVAAI